jgi:hypothetical protein
MKVSHPNGKEAGRKRAQPLPMGWATTSHALEKCCKNSRSSARPVNPILDGKENVAARKTRGSICIWGLVQEHLTTSSRR